MWISVIGTSFLLGELWIWALWGLSNEVGAAAGTTGGLFLFVGLMGLILWTINDA
jgi:hypothetical protein